MDDGFYQYPPELLALLVDTIPLLCRSKKDVLTFFRGAGVGAVVLAPWQDAVTHRRGEVTKYDIVRGVLSGVNEQGDRALRQRREILKRVTQFDDFSTCWPADQLKARGLVAQIRDVVNVKDAFTRMNIEREREAEKSRLVYAAEVASKQEIQAKRESIKQDFFALFGEPDHRKRGKLIEGVLNQLFQTYGILIREAFVLVGDGGEGVVEQVDGAIELDGHVYLVEVRWRDKPLGREDVSSHLVRVFGRHDARGLHISASGYTEPAVLTCKEALPNRTCVLAELKEFVMVVDRDKDLRELIRKKVQAALTEKKPLVYPD